MDEGRAELERQIAEHAKRYVDREMMAGMFFGTTAQVVENAPALTLQRLLTDTLRALTGFDWHVSDHVPAEPLDKDGKPGAAFMKIETPLVNGGAPLWLANTKRAEELVKELLRTPMNAETPGHR